MLSATGASWDCWEDVTISGCSEDTISGCSEDTISGCSEDTISGCSDDTISGCEGASEIAEIAETMLSATGASWDCWEDVTISGCSDDTISDCAEDTISGCSEDTIFGCKGASENMLSATGYCWEDEVEVEVVTICGCKVAWTKLGNSSSSSKSSS